jgi:hypothetical protein
MGTQDTSDHPIEQKPSSGKSFELNVADIYRSLGCKVEANIRLDGQEIDLLVNRYIEGMGPVSLLVECKDWARPIGNQVVQNIIATVNTLRAKGRVQFGVVVSKNGFTPDAKAAADGIPYVSLLTLDDLEKEIFDTTIGPRQLIRVYQAQEIFDRYVDINGSRTTWRDPTIADGPNTTIESMCSALYKSIVDHSMINYFILGDFGAGKSTLLRRLQYQLCQSKLEKHSSYLPIFVPLKNYYKTQNLSILLRNSLREDFLGEISADLLWVSIKQGRFAFLLDGFDEMTDRSDEGKRYALFEALLPILISPCPTVLTSRPSLFVAQGEIEELVSRWRNEAAPLRVTPTPLNEKAAKRYDYVEQLHARLLRRLRTSSLPHFDPSLPSDETLTVINIKPLDNDKIRQYLRRRFQADGKSSKMINSSVEEALAFIERTYDLSDLASRPLLLEMIVDTIMEGGVDITDLSLKMGPSALYEVYITLKLEVDWDKGDIRRRALNQAQRRDFAEAVAVTMHQAGRLDVALSDVLAVLGSDKVSARLSAEEIATDFLTCSFMTVDEDQTCRFVHKSFLEFLVAHRIKSRLTARNPLLQEELPTGVLYFLGGFAPTERSVERDLWALFDRTPVAQKFLRRNLLAAGLFVSTEHVSRKIRNAELDNVAYERLDLTKVNIHQSTMKAVEFRNLTLHQSVWADVELVRCKLPSWKISASSMSCHIAASELGDLSLNLKATSSISLDNCEVAAMKVNSSKGHFKFADISVAQLSVEHSQVSFLLLRSQVSNLHISESDVVIDRNDRAEELTIEKGVIERSVVRIDGRHQIAALVRFKDCFVEITRSNDTNDDPHSRRPTVAFLQMTANCCLFDTGATISVKQQAKDAECGLIGFECSDSIPILREFKGWGILIASGKLESDELLSDRNYLAVSSKLIICKRPWFMREILGNGELGAIVSKRDLVDLAATNFGAVTHNLIENLRQQIFRLSQE